MLLFLQFRASLCLCYAYKKGLGLLSNPEPGMTLRTTGIIRIIYDN